MSKFLCELVDYSLKLHSVGDKNRHLDSAAILLIRPGELMPDESGRHAGDQFMELHISRKTLREIADACQNDFEDSAIVAMRAAFSINGCAA